MTIGWIFLIISTVCNSIASILIKVASNKVGSEDATFSFISFPLLLAVTLFGVNLIFYLFALRHIPLFVAYPFVTGFTMLSVTIYSKYIFKTPIFFLDTLGVCLVLLGITLLTRSQ